MRYLYMLTILILSFSSLSGPHDLGKQLVNDKKALGKKSTNLVYYTDSAALYKIINAELALNRQLNDKAIYHYLDVTKTHGDATIAEYTTLLALSRGYFGTATEAAVIWASLAPEEIRAQYITSSLLISIGKPEDAKNYIVRVLSYPNEDDALRYFTELSTQALANENKLGLYKAMETLKEI